MLIAEKLRIEIVSSIIRLVDAPSLICLEMLNDGRVEY